MSVVGRGEEHPLARRRPRAATGRPPARRRRSSRRAGTAPRTRAPAGTAPSRPCGRAPITWSRTWRAWSASARRAGGVVLGLDRVEVGGERRLGVDHHVRPPGRRTTRSGRSRPSSPSTLCCSWKSQWSSMPAISTTRRSCSSPQRPRTCGARSARTRLPASVRSSPCASAMPELLASAGVRALARLLQLPQLPVELPQAVAHRREQLGDALLAPLQVAARALLVLLQAGPGQRQERRARFAQRLRRERLEGVGEPRPRVLEQRQLLLGRGALGLAPGLGLRRAPLGERGGGAGLAGLGLARGEARLEIGDARGALVRQPRQAAPGQVAGDGTQGQADGEEGEGERVHAPKLPRGSVTAAIWPRAGSSRACPLSRGASPGVRTWCGAGFAPGG